MKKPIHRSKTRILAGKIYYFLKKYYYWHFSGADFARNLESRNLPVEIFSHRTNLRRNLKDVEMWMQENKVVNLKIALKKLDGLVIEPFQTFSFWRQVGRPTKGKGYLEGMVLRDGKVHAGVGGGLCQLSNLLYWMALHTALTVAERWRHGYDVFPDADRKQPFGSGATCAWPNIDLEIRNDTRQKFQLRLEVTDEYLVGKWLSGKPAESEYEIFEKNHRIKNEWHGGYTRSNEIFRRITDKKTKETHEEFVTRNHAIMMYDPLLTAGKEDSTPRV